MPLRKKNATRAGRIGADVTISLGITAVILFFIATGVVSYWNTKTLRTDADQVAETHAVSLSLQELLSLAKDAETGQRGYVLTGDEKYLAPYTNARAMIDERLNQLDHQVAEVPELHDRVPILRQDLMAKLSELAETIELRRTNGFDAALAVVITDRGKNEMDIVRSQMTAMERYEEDLRNHRIEEMNEAYHFAIMGGLLSVVLGILLSIAIAALMRRSALARQRSEWLQTGQVAVSVAMLGEQRVEQLGENILKTLSEYLGAQASAFFSKDGDAFRRIATYGLSEGSNIPDGFTVGDGLLGQTAKDGKTFVVHDVPEGYLTISSALGKGLPRHLVITPTTADRAVNAVIEFGFIHPVNDLALELLERLADSIGVAIRSANYRANLRNFLEETQRQAEELQAQSEELRVANEELEEQSRSLKESQARLEQQQVEQEQTNAQLEEQTQILEGQRDDLTQTRDAVQQKARELERASRYKSDFLANMSHELRTPLNSSLILAKLLADNPQNNLSAEQVKFAQTIQSSGNDLLSLINDILDLSKIEAGHMEIRPEKVFTESIVKDLTRLFEPLVRQKQLTLKVLRAPGAPEQLETDRQRLDQVLKNLISNAIKFTEKGSVEITIAGTPDHKVAFAVKDTGIGISGDQQEAIFEAFRQADGTISRKYGGTGLGLSISRELTRLLGGVIALTSEAGHGSTFTVTLPTTYDPALVKARDGHGSEADEKGLAPKLPRLPDTDVLTKKMMAPTPSARFQKIPDDRDHLATANRVILIVEDDEPFAKIILDMVHELDFQGIVATTAEEALNVAMQYLPSAVILDVGLPDHSGLSVLDRLKRDGRTRHIPVHVISASDYAQTALALGAVGYMLKPVSRDKLSGALQRLEARFAQQMRRVLIVEDDPVQRESVSRLLGSHDVETMAVGTAAECLERLKSSTFDCMVLDLSLPDATGYSLLETLSQEDAYSFPPVIVYTGRDLSHDEETRLRKYSHSIIIKGAKSPERLLDEVTLFLHQVVADLPAEQQQMLERAKNRDSVLERRRILVVEDDVRNVYALTSIFEPLGAVVEIARNGREALTMLEKFSATPATAIDLILMDVMMPEMDGMTATREIRKNNDWKKLPIIMLTAKAMKDDQERCLDAGANDYMAKPLDVEKLLSLVRVWMPR